jgi:hypothetical protein
VGGGPVNTGTRAPQQSVRRPTLLGLLEPLQIVEHCLEFVGPVVADERHPLINGDGSVGVNDFLILLAAWGPCGDCNNCPADFDGDCRSA